MIALIKAELRKILTIRSTYMIVGISVLLVLFFAGFIDGYRATADSLKQSDLLSGEVLQAIMVTSVLGALVGLLLFAHEYRYNFVMYTLTVARSRWQVLLAKVIAVTIFIIPVTLVIGALSPLFALAGTHLHGLHLVHQSLNYTDLAWRSLFFGWAYAMFALVFVALVRSQVGAIVLLFIVPSTVEGILGLLLKDNVKYLPFTALSNVETMHPLPGTTPLHSALIVSVYLVIAWLAALILFIRRDAN